MPEIVFEGRRLRAREGATVAAALLEHGVRTFGRSAKYHRPRGVRCANGTCSCCAMRVDGLPGVRTCVTPVHDGMCVAREHAWPSADVDVLRVAELSGPLLHAGAYYRWFRRSPRLWGITERLLAGTAGQGTLPDAGAARRLAAARCETRRDIDVLVVGGGVAGLSAALAAARAGARTLLVDRHQRLGGGLAADTTPDPEAGAVVGLGGAPRGHEVAAALVRAAWAHHGLEALTLAEAVAWYEEGVVAVVRGPDLTLVEPGAVVLAAGVHELLPPFPNGDLPGVMSGAAAQRLLQVDGVTPGRRALIVTNGARGYALAAQLTGSGVENAGVADLRSASAIPEADRCAASDLGAEVIAGVRGMTGHGWNAVRAVTLVVRSDRRVGGVGRARRVACDLVCAAVGARPADELARQALETGRFSLAAPGAGGAASGGYRTLAGPGGARLFLTGGASGVWSAAEAIAGAAAAGAAAAAASASRSPGAS